MARIRYVAVPNIPGPGAGGEGGGGSGNDKTAAAGSAGDLEGAGGGVAVAGEGGAAGAGSRAGSGVDPASLVRLFGLAPVEIPPTPPAARTALISLLLQTRVKPVPRGAREVFFKKINLTLTSASLEAAAAAAALRTPAPAPAPAPGGGGDLVDADVAPQPPAPPPIPAHIQTLEVPLVFKRQARQILLATSSDTLQLNKRGLKTRVDDMAGDCLIARHVKGCRLTQETRVRHAC